MNSGDTAADCGRITVCTGSAKGSERVSCEESGRFSSQPSKEGPAYHGVASEVSTTLSPRSAETGMVCRSSTPSSSASACRSRSSASKASWASGTRSILLTATIRCGTPSSAATARWRRVCSTIPWVTSTSTISASAVDAPVTVLRVYCTWPGQSARMKLRAGVAK